MERALREIARVLRPGGRAWISEPVYAGDFNEIMRLFHDEKVAREAAFAALRKAVEDGCLHLERQFFFNSRSHCRDFADFDARIIRATHADYRLSDDIYRQARDKFNVHVTPEGAAFHTPNRVDMLRKPA